MLSVFPNPVSDFTTAELRVIAPLAPNLVQASIFNTRGIQLQQIDLKVNVGDNNYEFDFTTLPLGTYIIKFSIDWGSEIEELSSKLVKTN